MEVVLQWLDDLDDMVFGVVLAWDRVRRGLLQLGAAAAAAVTACADLAGEWVLPLAALAALSLAVAALGHGFAIFAAARSDLSRTSL